jgi:hypothetical protein
MCIQILGEKLPHNFKTVMPLMLVPLRVKTKTCKITNKYVKINKEKT